MSHIIHEQNLNSDSNSGPLNTPSPPMMNQIDTEDRVQGNLSIESMLSNVFPEFMNNIPLPSNPDLLQNTETIISDVRRLKKSTARIRKTLFKDRKSTKKIETTLHKHEEAIARIETSVRRQEESNKRIISLLEKFTSNNENIQQSLRSNLPSEFQLSVPERPTNHEESSSNRRIEDLPSESNSRPIETHRNPMEHTTTKSHGHLLYSPSIEIVDKIRAEKNRGKIQIGQWCYEINVGTTDDAPALLPPTTTKKLGNQLQNKEPPMNYQFSCQTKTTTNENLLSTSSKCISMKLSFVHPLNTHICDKTDRDTILTDCYGKTPVLLLDGENLPDSIDLQIAAISKSSKGCFQSIFRFSDGKNKYNNFDYRSIKIPRESSLPLKFELNNLKLRKRSNQSMKTEETFILKRYPSEEIENTKIKSLKELNEQYKFAEIQLAFSCDKKIISYSNLLSISPKQSDQYELEIKRIYSDENTTINFNNDNQCLMAFFIKIPEAFHCTLASRYKWIEISIIPNDSINPIYLIDIENGEKKNPNYINIEHPSFKILFKIIKQTIPNVIDEEIENLITGDINSILPINEFDRFRIQFRLLHSEVVPCEKSLKEYYINCKPWESEEFIENRKTGQKRTNEVLLDENNEWIINKTAKTTENVNTIV